MPKAAVLVGKQDFRFEEIPIPQISENEILVKPKAVGICGSDVDMYRGVYSGLWKLPVTPGHEFVGEVARVGANVKDLMTGYRVTSEEILWCGYCRSCKAGFPNFCQNLQELGFTVPGALAGYLKVDRKYAHKLPPNVSYEAGSLVEPTSVSYNAIFVQGGGLSPGDFVAVFGAGPIGLLSMMVSKVAGAQVAVIEISEKRRIMAENFGADHVLNPREVDVVKEIKNLTEGYGANMSVECTANESVVSTAIECLRFRGKAVLVGMLEKPSTINGITLVRKGLSLVGSLGHSGHDTFPHVIDLIARGVIDPTKLITHRFELNNVKDAFEQASRRDESMKITIFP